MTALIFTRIRTSPRTSIGSGSGSGSGSGEGVGSGSATGSGSGVGSGSGAVVGAGSADAAGVGEGDGVGGGSADSSSCGVSSACSEASDAVSGVGSGSLLIASGRSVVASVDDADRACSGVVVVRSPSSVVVKSSSQGMALEPAGAESAELVGVPCRKGSLSRSGSGRF